MTQEYVTDVPYVRGFEKSLSPTQLRLCAALNGFRAPPADDFDYCELGCAQGDTTVALAAAFPRARFVGVDLNEAHIATARTLALGGEVGNVRFLERDFEALGEDDLPRLDYVVAHGVLSWIGPQKRKTVLDLISRQLKDGGLAYVSYNALPGWAAIEPLRQLILARGAEGATSTERARAGVELATALDKAGAYYFEANPGARKMLETMKTMGLSYIAHEYLHAHWVPMYFAQIASEMAERDLYFVGQLPAYLNYRDLAIPEALQPIFATVGDRLAFEGLKDYAVNTYFRKDVFVKGRAGRDAAVTQEYLDTTPIGMLGDEPTTREARLPNHTLRFKGPVFDALFPALDEGAASLATLQTRADLSTFDRARLRDALLHLVLGGRATPLQTPTHRSASVGKLSVPSAYNRWVLQRGFVTEVPVIVTAPSMGNGVQLSMVDAAGLYLALEPDAAKRAEWVKTFSAQSLTHLVVGDRRAEDPRELEALVTANAERFRTERLAKMIELGIVASEP